jgi:hypothetical protein
MTSAKLVALLALTLCSLAANAAFAQAATHVRNSSDEARISGSLDAASAPALPTGASFCVDPSSGKEIYLPTGETVDQVIPVIGSRLTPANVAARTCPPTVTDFDLWTLGGALLLVLLSVLFLLRDAKASRDWSRFFEFENLKA